MADNHSLSADDRLICFLLWKPSFPDVHLAGSGPAFRRHIEGYSEAPLHYGWVHGLRLDDPVSPHVDPEVDRKARRRAMADVASFNLPDGDCGCGSLLLGCKDRYDPA